MITKRNLYTIVFIALGIIAVTGIYYLSRKSPCCSCHVAAPSSADTLERDHEHLEDMDGESLSVDEVQD